MARKKPAPAPKPVVATLIEHCEIGAWVRFPDGPPNCFRGIAPSKYGRVTATLWGSPFVRFTLPGGVFSEPLQVLKGQRVTLGKARG